MRKQIARNGVTNAAANAAPSRAPTGTEADRLSEAERQALAARLQQRMDALSLNVAQVAERASIGHAVVYKLLAAQQNNPDFVVLRALSRALLCPLDWLLGDVNDPAVVKPATVRIRYEAALDTFQSTNAPAPSGEAPDIAPADLRYRDMERFPVRLRDGSLDGLEPPALDGYIAHVIAFAPERMEIEHGSVYLMVREIAPGVIQRAFRRATVYQDRYEFAAVSRDKAVNEASKLVIARKDLENSGVVIDGLLYAITYQYK